MRPKILHLVNQSAFGGTQQYIIDLAQYQASQNYEIVIAAGEQNDEHFVRAVQSLSNTQFYHLRYVSSRISPIRDIKAIGELRSLIKTIQPTVIHIHSPKLNFLTSIAVRCSMLHAQCSMIYTVHGFWLNEPKGGVKYALHYLIEWLGARFMNATICVSNRDATDMVKTNIIRNASKLRVIYPSLNPMRSKFLSSEQAKTILQKHITTDCSHKRIVGFIANLYAGKGASVLIDAINHIPDPNTIAVIIGNGDERESLKSQAERHKLHDRVFFLGYIPNAFELMPAFDVFVLPSDKEGLPVVLLEANACGIPVVTTPVGGVPEIAQTNWTLVPPRDPEELAKAIEKALHFPKLPSKTTQELSDEYQTFLQKTQDVYNRVLAYRT